MFCFDLSLVVGTRSTFWMVSEMIKRKKEKKWWNDSEKFVFSCVPSCMRWLWHLERCDVSFKPKGSVSHGPQRRKAGLLVRSVQWSGWGDSGFEVPRHRHLRERKWKQTGCSTSPYHQVLAYQGEPRPSQIFRKHMRFQQTHIQGLCQL